MYIMSSSSRAAAHHHLLSFCKHPLLDTPVDKAAASQPITTLHPTFISFCRATVDMCVCKPQGNSSHHASTTCSWVGHQTPVFKSVSTLHQITRAYEEVDMLMVCSVISTSLSSPSSPCCVFDVVESIFLALVGLLDLRLYTAVGCLSGKRLQLRFDSRRLHGCRMLTGKCDQKMHTTQ
jgi:hypothetical protein